MMNRIVVCSITLMMSVLLHAGNAQDEWSDTFNLAFCVTGENIYGLDNLADEGSRLYVDIDFPYIVHPDLCEWGSYRLRIGDCETDNLINLDGIGTYIHCLIFDNWSLSGWVLFNPSAGTPGGIISSHGCIIGGNVYLWVNICAAPLQDGRNINGCHYVTSRLCDEGDECGQCEECEECEECGECEECIPQDF